MEHLYIPATIPSVLFAQLLPSKEAGKVVCDALINWQSHAEPLVIRVALTVVVNWPRPRFATFDVHMTVNVFDIYGKMHFECDPFPSSRFLLSFYQVGAVVVVVVVRSIQIATSCCPKQGTLVALHGGQRL